MGFVQYGYVQLIPRAKITSKVYSNTQSLTVTYFAVIPYKLNPVARIYSGRTKITRLNTHYRTLLFPSQRNITKTTATYDCRGHRSSRPQITTCMGRHRTVLGSRFHAIDTN